MCEKVNIALSETNSLKTQSYKNHSTCVLYTLVARSHTTAVTSTYGINSCWVPRSSLKSGQVYTCEKPIEIIAR